MKGFNLNNYDQNKLSTSGKQLFTNIEQLILKRRIEGGLTYQDEFQLSDSIKKLELDYNKPLTVLDAEGSVQELLPDLASDNTIVMNTDSNEDTDKFKQIFSGFLTELKKLPLDIRPEKEVFKENPLYKSYISRLPEDQKPVTIRVRIPERVK